MSLLIAACAQFELADPWQSKLFDPDVTIKKISRGKAKIRKLVQVSRKTNMHWRLQLVDAIKNQSVKLDTSAVKLGANTKRIAVNNPTHQIGMAAKPITQFEQIGLTAPRPVLQAATAVQTPKNNNRLVLALSGLSAIGAAGLYLSNRSNKK